MDHHLANKRAVRARPMMFNRDMLHADAVFHVYHPVNELQGRAAIEAGLLNPLHAAFPDLERREDTIAAGSWQGHDWVCTSGHYAGTFANPLLRIPATGSLAFLRFGEIYRLVEGRIAEAYIHLDFLDLMRQAGCNPLPASPGADILVPGPLNHDGLLLTAQDPAESAASLALVEAMIGGLLSFDGRTLESMGMERFWRSDMLWYGPCGIGSTRGLSGFQRFHQRPFLVAFPDRRGAGHKARIADGHFVVTTGWPSVRATFSGPWLGQAPSGRPIDMRVTDIWRRDGDLLAENWVMIDIPDVMRQAGYDLFAHLPA
jgi:predicted ester cyclase